jgi:hypothetical protein
MPALVRLTRYEINLKLGRLLFHWNFFSSIRTSSTITTRQSGLMSNPSLQQRFAQNWCPLEVRTKSWPHSAQTNGSRGSRSYFSDSIALPAKKAAGSPAGL